MAGQYMFSKSREQRAEGRRQGAVSRGGQSLPTKPQL